MQFQLHVKPKTGTTCYNKFHVLSAYTVTFSVCLTLNTKYDVDSLSKLRFHIQN